MRSFNSFEAPASAPVPNSVSVDLNIEVASADQAPVSDFVPELCFNCFRNGKCFS